MGFGLYRITYKLCLIMHLGHTSRAPQYLSDCVQTVARSSLVSDPLTQPPTSNRGAEPSSASAVSGLGLLSSSFISQEAAQKYT